MKETNTTAQKLLISIVGPTATGKTSFALQLCRELMTKKKFSGFDLISADSRQVYSGMEIVTGATDNQLGDDGFIRIFGISMVKPDEEWSVAHFQQYALPLLENSWAQGRLPIVVGGTGLYHQCLVNKDPQLRVAPNLILRQEVSKMTLLELQNKLKSKAEQKWLKLNSSDRSNPRRLIRAIEIFEANLESKSEILGSSASSFESISQIIIGLTDLLESIANKIKSRVNERLQQGAVEEVKKLKLKYGVADFPAFSATGFKEISQWMEGKVSEDEMKKLWSTRELQYAKRQLTWWRQDDKIKWWSVSSPGWDREAIDSLLRLL